VCHEADKEIMQSIKAWSWIVDMHNLNVCTIWYLSYNITSGTTQLLYRGAVIYNYATPIMKFLKNIKKE